MSEKKSKLEIVLMPVVIAVVGIVGSFIISYNKMENEKQQKEMLTIAAKQQADADRDVKIIEIFADKIMSTNIKERELALNFLDAVNSDIAEKLARAVSKTENKNTELKYLADRQAAKIAQRTFTKTKQENSLSICDKYSEYTNKEWNKLFLKTTEDGTWHVFVSSLSQGSEKTDAEKIRNRYKILHPNNDFKIMETISTSNDTNHRYAIVIAEGLKNKNIAMEIAKYADQCNISDGAYAIQQTF